MLSNILLYLDGEINNTYAGCMKDLPKEEIGSKMYKIIKK